MNIEAFLLCDAATDSAGKLNVLGAFDQLLDERRIETFLFGAEEERHLHHPIAESGEIELLDVFEIYKDVMHTGGGSHEMIQLWRKLRA